MKLEPWEVETLEILRRSLEKGVERGIQTKNWELLDFCTHGLHILGELRNESESEKRF